MRCLFLLCLSGALGVFTAPARAQDADAPPGWALGVEACGAVREFEGAGLTELVLYIGPDGGGSVGIVNGNWTIIEGAAYKVELELGDRVFGGYAQGVRLLGKLGLQLDVSRAFFDAFSKASSLRVRRRGAIIDRLALDGSARVVALVRQCAESQALELGRDAARARALADIPRDPFLGSDPDGPAPGNPGNLPAIAIGTWITSEDYPSSISKQFRPGKIVMDLTIAADGRVSQCHVRLSSGLRELDDHTCAILKRRASGLGVSGGGVYSVAYQWRGDGR